MVSEGTKGRFTLTGKVQGGDCSFSISNAQPADQGEYEFQIEDGNHKYSYSSYRLSVTVTGANGQTPGYTLYAQPSVWVSPGLSVHIPCIFTVPAGSTLSTRVTGIWKRKETPDIVAASTEASMVYKGTKGRFTLTGKVHEGDCSFSISNAQPADQGFYEFQIEDGDHKHFYTSYKLSVSVTASTNDCIIHTQTKGRFTLTGKVQEGDCSFSISNAQPADRGVYEFRIEDGNHKYSYIWNHLFVSVTDLPEPTISPIGELIAGKPITLTCTAHPAPQGCKGIITWGGRINIENMSNYEREDQAGKVTSISDITVTPSQREHNSPLTCTVTYSGVSTNSSITLGVQCKFPLFLFLTHIKYLLTHIGFIS
uniref:Ig-like domain-containing protein n=1 Tax=Xenopus tropicalis TaxID=8364 RepID=L7N388_XENTR